MNESYAQHGNNAPEMSVTELAQGVKRTLEDAYGRVRVRGELSRVKVVSSGHMYSDLKDENSVINVICWRGSLAKLAIKPEEGLDVICTGRMTTYPQRSNYQLIIESMELAGEGALLKMLEERKKKLHAEGLFANDRKKQLPFLPERIGVITSPTGAVIRDILHRLSDRFPRPVMLWPVRVQGDEAANEITAALNGFNALPDQQKPDLLILARGGGSLEDLMAFNEENVVRAVAASGIPIITAVGHETDTTLVDYASDRRAPTPTGAAEMAVPERLMLLARVDENQARLSAAMSRQNEQHKKHVTQLSARILDPRRIIEIKAQNLDHQFEKVKAVFTRRINQGQQHLLRLSAKITHPSQKLGEAKQRTGYAIQNLARIRNSLLSDQSQILQGVSRLLDTLSYQSILKRGYSVIRDETGTVLSSANMVENDMAINLQFHDGMIAATAHETASKEKPRPVKKAKTSKDPNEKPSKKNPQEQGDLF